jgi:hypothetical protein
MSVLREMPLASMTDTCSVSDGGGSSTGTSSSASTAAHDVGVEAGHLDTGIQALPSNRDGSTLTATHSGCTLSYRQQTQMQTDTDTDTDVET